jgi:hypothetical protein
MRKLLNYLAFLTLTLSLAACAGSSQSPEGCCAMGKACCKAEGKPMTCEQKEKSAGCCSKGAAEGKPQEGHQH